MSRLDLWDVGVCCVQRVEVHFVELIVELLSKLPGQIVMAVRSQRDKVTHTEICPDP